MERYEGPEEVFTGEEIAEAEALEELANQLQIERRQWEGERDSIAEYESWFLAKTIMEADAEKLCNTLGTSGR